MNQQTRQAISPTHQLRFLAPFATTERGAHEARRAAEQWLTRQLSPDEPGADDLARTAALVVAELAANAALHGRVRGGDACLELRLDAGELRIEVTDARGDRQPVPGSAEGGRESGRGLLLVGALADEWGARPHCSGGKTVWAVCRR